jgi:type I restriction enzyme S subunit
VILARTGETRGKALTGYRGIFHNNTFRLNYDKDLIERRYLIYWLETHFVQSYIISQSSKSAQPDLTHKAFGPCPFPLAPLIEQREIVRHVEALFKLADQIETSYQRAKPLVDKLPQAILAKAFRGELVPTEAELARREGRDYEPASVLLERIRSERADYANGRKEKVRPQPRRAKLERGAKQHI